MESSRGNEPCTLLTRTQSRVRHYLVFELPWFIPSTLFWVWLLLLRGKDLPLSAQKWIWLAPFGTVIWRAIATWSKKSKPRTLVTAVAFASLLSFTYAPFSTFLILKRLAAKFSFVFRGCKATLAWLLFSDPGIADASLALCIAGTWIGALVATHEELVVALTVLDITLINVIVVRALRWAYSPIQPFREAYEKFLKPWAQARMALGVAFGQLASQSGKRGVGLHRLGCDYLRKARRLAKRIPAEEGQLIPFFVLAYLLIAGIIVAGYAVAFYALTRANVPQLVLMHGETSLLSYWLASLAIFTTAPISAVQPTGSLGAAFCTLEIVNAVLMLVLFFSLLFRGMAGRSFAIRTELRKEKETLIESINEEITSLGGDAPDSESLERRPE